MDRDTRVHGVPVVRVTVRGALILSGLSLRVSVILDNPQSLHSFDVCVWGGWDYFPLIRENSLSGTKVQILRKFFIWYKSTNTMQGTAELEKEVVPATHVTLVATLVDTCDHDMYYWYFCTSNTSKLSTSVSSSVMCARRFVPVN